LPGDLEAGRSELNVLVQDRDRLQVAQDAMVVLQAKRKGSSQSTDSVRASVTHSENKLLQNADVELPTPGDWTLSVRMSRGDTSAEAVIPVHVVKPQSGFSMPWPFATFGVFAAVLMFVYWRRHGGVTRVRVRRTLSTSTRV
jgi:hypothetical protein